MCLEDIRIGRFSRAYYLSTLMAAGVIAEIAPEDKNRIAIIIGSPTTGTLFFGHDPNITVLTGIPLPTAFPPILLSIKDYGEIVTGKIFGIVAAGTPTVSIWCSSFHIGEWMKQGR
jgi:hypothetical protein